MALTREQEIAQGFASGAPSAGLQFLMQGRFTTSKEALAAAAKAGVRIGAGDIMNFFVSGSASQPSLSQRLASGDLTRTVADQRLLGDFAIPEATTNAVKAPSRVISDYIAPSTQVYAGSGQAGVKAPSRVISDGIVAPTVDIAQSGEFIPAGAQTTGAPPTGLIGSEQAILQGALGAQNRFMGAEQALRGGLEGGLEGISRAQDFTQEGLANALSQLSGGFNEASTNAQTQTEKGISALRSALNSANQQSGVAIGSIDAARDRGVASFDSGIQGIQQFVAPGQQSQQLQAALSGALGSQAQEQAFANFTASPGQEFLRERGERAITRNASAMGGLGGGRVRQELQRQGVGLAQQDFQNQFDRLGQITGQGQLSAGQAGQLRGQQASFLGQLGQARAGLQQQQGTNALGVGSNILEARRGLGETQAGLSAQRGLTGANLFSQAGTQLAGQGMNAGNLAFQTGNQLAQGRMGQGQMAFNTGQLLSGGRTRAGEQIANAALGTSGNLASLANQLGTGTSNVIGQGGGNLANLLSGAGTAQAGSQSQLMTLLANLATQQGSTIAGLPGVPGIQQTSGIMGGLGQAASGAGAVMSVLSDVSLKENIHHTGVSRGGHNLYTWDWSEVGRKIAGNQPGFGVLAQELQETMPDAVTRGEDGFLRVDYSRIH